MCRRPALLVFLTGLRPLIRTAGTGYEWLARLVFGSGPAYAILRSGVLPRWTGRLAYAVALVNLAFVPSLFFGTDAADFYSAVGWATPP
ncbi:hypothetical protein ABTY59_35085 [Streptomyces sp. NPDC096079]|uniref:hypothetical protein n=1 Tax=Streptomyces sp. NPDC096079 TaxID=3155820 RepID=UPI00331FEC6C